METLINFSILIICIIALIGMVLFATTVKMSFKDKDGNYLVKKGGK